MLPVIYFKYLQRLLPVQLNTGRRKIQKSAHSTHPQVAKERDAELRDTSAARIRELSEKRVGSTEALEAARHRISDLVPDQY